MNNTAASTLPISTNNNSAYQPSTEDPQASSQTPPMTIASTSLQPITPTSALTKSVSGIPLQQFSTGATRSVPAVNTPSEHQGVSMPLLIVVIVFVMLAIASFVYIQRSAKNTTY